MSKRKNRRQDEVSAIDAAVGSLVSWVAGKDSLTRGRGPTDGAVGELLSWVTGRAKSVR